MCLLLGEDKILTISNSEGDTLRTAPLRGEPSDLQFSEMKTDERASGENTVSPAAPVVLESSCKTTASPAAPVVLESSGENTVRPAAPVVLESSGENTVRSTAPVVLESSGENTVRPIDHLLLKSSKWAKGCILDDCVCVCFIGLDMTILPWWRVKVMVYYYYYYYYYYHHPVVCGYYFLCISL